MNKYTYYTASNKTGFMVEGFNDYDEAMEAIKGYEKKDREAGIHRGNMYRIVNEDHYPIYRYLVKITNTDGSIRKLDAVTGLEGYSAEDYIKEYGITDANVDVQLLF